MNHFLLFYIDKMKCFFFYSRYSIHHFLMVFISMDGFSFTRGSIYLFIKNKFNEKYSKHRFLNIKMKKFHFDIIRKNRINCIPSGWMYIIIDNIHCTTQVWRNENVKTLMDRECNETTTTTNRQHFMVNWALKPEHTCDSVLVRTY